MAATFRECGGQKPPSHKFHGQLGVYGYPAAWRSPAAIAAERCVSGQRIAFHSLFVAKIQRHSTSVIVEIRNTLYNIETPRLMRTELSLLKKLCPTV